MKSAFTAEELSAAGLGEIAVGVTDLADLWRDHWRAVLGDDLEAARIGLVRLARSHPERARFVGLDSRQLEEEDGT